MTRGLGIIGVVTVGVLTAAASDRPTQPRLNTLKDVRAALATCWVPPPIDQSHPGMQITVLASFKRNGELLGKPRITFQSAGASDEKRLAYRVAVMKMLLRCTPLRFSDSLGGAIAGRPFLMRFVDNRNFRQVELWVSAASRQRTYASRQTK